MTRFDRPEELLSELVAIPSESGSEEAAAELVVEWCRAAELDVERIGNSVVARVGSGATRLLYASHIDTVPIGAGWSGDPLDPTWRNGKLVARGANDAGASVVAMLAAAAHWQRAGGLEGELLVALNACEETSNAGMAAVLEHVGMPDAAVVGEPTGLEVVRAQAGLAVLVAEWSGSSCHAAHVATVAHENALVLAAQDLASFDAWMELPTEHPLLGRSTIAPTMFTSGERHNVVPDRAEAVFDARIAPPYDGAACAEVLSRRLPQAEVRVRSDRLKPIETAAEHPLVQAALSVAGREAAVGSNTMSDMALLVGVPAVKCGPGETARSHTPDEFLLESELAAGCAFYRDLAPRALRALQTVEVQP